MEESTFAEPCPRCDAPVGALHVLGCDVERCRLCGSQLLGHPLACDAVNDKYYPEEEVPHDEQDWTDEIMDALSEKAYWAQVDDFGGRLPWPGEWPGVMECREFGWYINPEKTGLAPCSAEDEGATEDLFRIRLEAGWDARAGRYRLPRDPRGISFDERQERARQRAAGDPGSDAEGGRAAMPEGEGEPARGS